jgi:ABC-type oligopeptide transport system substrate-binding subunit
MHPTRTALLAFVVMVAVAAVACQPTEGLAEPGARQSHPVIDVPEGPTLLPPAPAPASTSPAAPAGTP